MDHIINIITKYVELIAKIEFICYITKKNLIIFSTHKSRELCLKRIFF